MRLCLLFDLASLVLDALHGSLCILPDIEEDPEKATRSEVINANSSRVILEDEPTMKKPSQLAVGNRSFTLKE